MMSALSSALRKEVLIPIALAGLIGEVAFEVYAWLVSPLLFGVTLQPSNLVIAIVAKLTGLQLSHLPQV